MLAELTHRAVLAGLWWDCEHEVRDQLVANTPGPQEPPLVR